MKSLFKNILLILSCLICFAILHVDSQVISCYWFCSPPQATLDHVTDNTLASTTAEPVVGNIFYAPEVCPKGFISFQGRCRQMYYQPHY